jgi:hypothetical protein
MHHIFVRMVNAMNIIYLFFVFVILTNVVTCEPFVECVKDLQREYEDIENCDIESLSTLSDRILNCTNIIKQYHEANVLNIVIQENFLEYERYGLIMMELFKKYVKRVRELKEDYDDNPFRIFFI